MIPQCVGWYFRAGPSGWWAALVGSLLVGALAWWGCLGWVRAWNRSYQWALGDWAVAGVVSVVVAACLVAGFSLGAAPEVFAADVAGWREDLAQDEAWKATVTGIIQNRLREAEGKAADAPVGGAWELLYRSQKTQRLVAEIYTQEAERHFEDNIRRLSAHISPDRLYLEIRQATEADKGRTYDMKRAPQVVADEILHVLEGQSVVQVLRWRLLLGAVAAAATLAGLGWLGVRAFADIRVHKAGEGAP